LNDKQDFDNVKWLSDTDTILAKIQKYSKTTQRNMVTSVIVVLKAIDAEEYEKPLVVYKASLLALNDTINEQYSKHEKTEHEAKNWLTLDELKQIQSNYEQQVKDRNIKDKTILNSADTKLLQSYMVSSLYTLQPPVRLDYAGMKIVKTRKDVEEGINYLVIIGVRRKYFIFQSFKNVDKIGPQEMQVNNPLNKVINLYLKFNSTDDFLLNARGFDMSSNSLSKLIPKVFQKGNKTVHLNMIRKAWVSDTVDVEQSKKEQDLAEAMHHSEAVQKGVYLKED
jgi:hypothetical protein